MIGRIVMAVVLVGTSTAAAEPEGDGYCDFVEGTAAARSVLDLSPELFTNVGYIEQSDTSLPPSQDVVPRVIGGVRYRLSGIYQGVVARDHAHADCRRHEALSQVRDATRFHALEARANVLDAALGETAKLLAQDDEDLKAQRTTAREVTATRLRVEELRQLAADTRRQLAAAPKAETAMTGAVAAYRQADRDLEATDRKLRRAQAFDVSVRAGFDQNLDRSTPTRYFAVVGVSVNLGVVFQGGSNDRAARGRERLARSGNDPATAEASETRLVAVVELETRRAAETAALVADLTHSLEQIGKIGGEDAKRYRQLVWFDWVKATADHAYLTAHLEALHRVLETGGR